MNPYEWGLIKTVLSGLFAGKPKIDEPSVCEFMSMKGKISDY